MLSPEFESTHLKQGGTLGGVEPSFAPIEIADTFAAFRIGIRDLVIPGTSLCDSVLFLGLPNRSSSRNVEFKPSAIMVFPMISS